LTGNSKARSGRQFGFDLVNNVTKGCFVMNRKIGQHFAVDLDGCFAQAIGKLAVSDAKFTSSRVRYTIVLEGA